jgi:Nif-specific regulatory protein
MEMTDWEEKYHKLISLFYSISTTISPGMDISDMLSAILDTMSEYLDVERGMITILNRKTAEIITSVSYGMTDEETAKGRYQLGEGITGTVVATGEPIVIPSIKGDSRFLNRTGAIDDDDRAFICVPVKSTTEIIGSLSADRNAEIHALEDDLKVMTVIATMISRVVRLHQSLYEEQQHLMEENQRLHERLIEKYHPKNIVGNSSAMRSMYKMIEKVAQSNSTVLVLGESGVGKELVAQAIHYAGPRAENPFITFNCAALPESLLESELFGHSKGSFTGAVSDKTGKFETAHTGTIFLDEVGELTPAAQSKLLRVLQEREIERIGTNKKIRVDVRVIAATNRDLMQDVEEGTFRLDLYYRLNVFPINVPALRERKSDIPVLTDTFIEKYARENSKSVTRISTPAIDMLMSYHWPGNVRELENCIERAVVLTDDDTIHAFHLPPSLQIIRSFIPEEGGKLQKHLDILEYELVVEELKRTHGNIRQAAENLGISYRQFGLRIEKYDIDIRKFKISKNKGRIK